MFAKYTEFNMDLPDTLQNVRKTKLQLPYQMTKQSEERILLVFDSVNNSDYQKKKMLSGLLGTFLETVDRESKKLCGDSIFKHNVFTINLNYVTSDGGVSDDADTEEENEDSQNQEKQNEDLNKKRVMEFFKKLKPTRVITFGRKSFQIFNQYYKESFYLNATWTNLQGVPVDIEVGNIKCKLVPLLNPNWLCTYQDSRDPYLIGYFIRTWANAITGKIRFNIELQPEDIKIQVVDTIKKFDKMLKYLNDAKVVGIDTETDNLNRIDNRIVIIQFSISKRNAFVLPLFHFETPFNKQELEYICEKLRDYFLDNNNDLHLYANANFDIPIIRVAFKFPFYKNEIWDVQAGGYALDENLHELASVCGDGSGYYALGNMCIQYGFTGYITGKFGKEDRAGISRQPLNTPGLINYCGFDVAVLLGIYEQQVLQGKEKKHDKYENVVKNLIGDTIHTFSTMNVNGVLVDKKYLWWLSSKNSPINGEVKLMEDEILLSPEVKVAEGIIRKDNKVPSHGLFGAVQSKIFNLRKKIHLRTLFFNVLKLEPINVGADGPALDKVFQDEYAEVPLVAAYTGLAKAKKIRDAFVKSLIKIMGKNDDAKKDSRIRPSFNYLRVVTGRTSANNPNLQQVPSRGKLSKYIKRVFIARPGTVFIKVDYSAHEVRGWSLISGDKVLAKAFQAGIDLYKIYLANPTPENLKKFEEEGDIHIINSAYFFGLKVHEVTKDIRQSVKGVTFGLIYGRSARSLSVQLNKSLEEVDAIIAKFFTRFKVAANWLLEVEKFARKNYYVEAPTGLRRHLWPYLLPNTKERDKMYQGIAAACDRRARNSPIQGMGSGIGYSAARYLETWVFKRFRKVSLKNGQLPIRNQNMVHDSMEHEVDIPYIIYATEMIRESLTIGVQSKCVEKFKMNFPVDLSIDMDIGATLDTVQKWDGSIQELHRILKETFEYQRDELKYDIDPEAELKRVFSGYMSEVLNLQAQNGYFTEAKTYGMAVAAASTTKKRKD